MSDIAILVAEEYERRLKNSRKAEAEADVGGDGQMEITFGSSVSFMAERIKAKITDNNMELLKFNNLVFEEPKTQIGLAAFNGLFSA